MTVDTDLLAQFTDRLTAVGGIVTSAAASPQVMDAILAEGVHELWISQEAATAAPALIDILKLNGVNIRIPENAGQVRDQPFGLAIARAAIAETGSSLLVEPEVADRSVTLMTETLFVLCPSKSLLSTLADAAPILREVNTPGPSYATFVTGPSRTADIERQLTVGVQGPGRFHLIFVDSLT